jgi:hypothetical protein
MCIFDGACTGPKAGINEKIRAARSLSTTPGSRFSKSLLRQIQHRRGHRHNAGANRWFRHGCEPARMQGWEWRRAWLF